MLRDIAVLGLRCTTCEHYPDWGSAPKREDQWPEDGDMNGNVNVGFL